MIKLNWFVKPTIKNLVPYVIGVAFIVFVCVLHCCAAG